jgi:hypothetical protein
LHVPEDKKRWRGYPGEVAFVVRLGLYGYGHYPFWKFGSLSKLNAWIADPSAELHAGPVVFRNAGVNTSCIFS